jgi:KDO2-lipid IV(A) lauroyltransferase
MPITSILPPTTGSPEPSLLSSYWQPRYWPTWLLIGILRATAALPWRVAIKLYKGIGLVLFPLLRSRRQLIERNISLRFPELGPIEVRNLSRQHFKDLAACLAETAFAWFGRVDDSLVNFEIEGDEHVLSALKAGHGVILYTGHFTSIEICGPAIKRLFPTVAIMFHRRRNPLLNELQRRGRRHSGHDSFADDNIRAMLSSLRAGAVVWYAADQSHSHYAQQQRRKGDDAIDGDTTTCRIARISGAVVVPLSYRRRRDDSGYVIRFGKALQEFPSNLDATRARQLDDVLRQLITECPAQYGWTYKRLRTPSGIGDQKNSPKETH